LGVDDRADLAVLKVDAGYDLPFVKWGDSDTAEVGDWSLAVGNPFGLGGTLTLGIISARARNINAGPYDDFIQTDASINRGNSGGPLLNLAGEVIGINTAIFSPTGASVGIGFAIPSNLARPSVDQLIEFGRTRRGWLGVRIQRVTGEIAQGLGLDEAKGALIADVSADGPAGAAGIALGDVILTFDGKGIPEMRSLTRVVAETSIDAIVDVEIWRDGRTQTLQVRVGELTDVAVAALAGAPPGGLRDSTASLGISLAEVTSELREQYGLTLDGDGVLVTGVQAATDAAARNIQPGDVILEVGRETVRTPADVVRFVEAARAENRSSLLILLQERDGDLRYVPLSLEQG
jgi:serine protease Do